MNKIKLFLLTSSALALIACIREHRPISESSDILTELKVSCPDSRVAIADGVSYWEEGDEINLFSAGKSAKFSSSSSGTSTVFRGKMLVSSGAPLFGLYPYDQSATLTGTAITTSLPAVQSASAGSYSANIRIGCTSTNDMVFMNACGALKFKLAAEGVRKVTLRSVNATPICGDVTFEWQDGQPVLSSVSKAGYSICLSPEGGTFEPGKYYYIAVLPGIVDDFELVMETSSRSCTYLLSSYNFKRNTNKVLDNPDLSGSWTGKVLTFDFSDDENWKLCTVKSPKNADYEVQAIDGTKYGMMFNNCYSASGTYGGGSSETVKYMVIDRGYIGLPVIPGYRLTSASMTLGNRKSERYISVNFDQYSGAIMTGNGSQTVLKTTDTSVDFTLNYTVAGQRYYLYSKYTHVIGTLTLTYEPAEPSLETIDRLVACAIQEGTIPGAVLGVVKDGEIKYLKAWGNRQVTPTVIPMTTDVVFDMMSVTKVACTTLAVMKLIEEGVISLDDRVSDYLTDFQPSDPLTIEQLMTHISGFPTLGDLVPAENYAGNPAGLLKYLSSYSRSYAPGEHYSYSCTNFFLLHQIVEKMTGERLCDYAKRNFYDVLGMDDTMQLPLDEPIPSEYYNRIAPCAGVANIGKVADGYARTVCRGNAGNAGLFSTTSDMLILGQALLNGGIYQGRRILNQETVSLMATVPDLEVGRALGWDCLSSNSYQKGAFSSRLSIWHTGYCGTMIVVDFENNMCIVLNSNRSHPSDTGYNAWMRHRGLIHGAIGAVMLQE